MNTSASINLSAPTRRRLTVEEYHRMGEIGILTDADRTELIDGEIYQMAPIGSRHAYVVNRLAQCLIKETSAERFISIQNPLRLSPYGEPEPDIAVVRNKDYFHSHPEATDVFLIIEVSEQSLAYDRDTKLPRYAEHGIPEVWIVNIPDRCIERYQQPLPDSRAYQQVERIGSGPVTPAAMPEFVVQLKDLFP